MGRDNAYACNRELGAELRKRRKAAGMSAGEVADFTGWDRSKVSRVESGNVGTSEVDVIHYLGACKIWVPHAQDLLQLCRTAGRRLGYWLTPQGEWMDSVFSSLIFHESTAAAITLYDPLVVNGLLQTADYARALISREEWRNTENIEHCVGIRMDRQRILTRTRPARFTFFVHEHALRRQVGTKAVTHEQLMQAVLLAALPQVTLRVVPATAAGPFGAPFQVLSFEQHQPLVYLDNQACGLFLEDKEFVATYRRLVPHIEEVALDEGQSREFVAALASEFDRGSTRDAGIYQLEEEHL
ncbi:MAG: helix-turn-helix domain-containing protein [Pseudonocardiaceae bacterium]|nr:helix-turn-helix domain-containing protein [Pseudonocardiaceae bacterium]